MRQQHHTVVPEFLRANKHKYTQNTNEDSIPSLIPVIAFIKATIYEFYLQVF